MKVLIIGGPRDGEWWEIPRSTRGGFEAADPVDRNENEVRELEASFDMNTPRSSTFYRLETFRDEFGDYLVATPADGMKTSLLVLLFAAYQGRAKREAYKKMPPLLLEARDALPAITEAAARLSGIRLDLADRIEDALTPWRAEE